MAVFTVTQRRPYWIEIGVQIEANDEDHAAQVFIDEFGSIAGEWDIQEQVTEALEAGAEGEVKVFLDKPTLVGGMKS